MRKCSVWLGDQRAGLGGPHDADGVLWSSFWIGMGVTGLLIGVALFVLLPRRKVAAPQDCSAKGSTAALITVFKNPQTILCGLIAGLLVLPTTVFDMTWGVRYLQEGVGFEYGNPVMRSATVPLGGIIGCPLLGLLSDR